MPNRYRVLLIDDDESIHELVLFSLQTRGYDLIQAFSGREGLEKAGRLLPDLILLDLNLSDLNGVEVRTFLQNNEKTGKIPVIVLTGLTKSSEILKSAVLALGRVELIEKPFSPSVLAEKVAAMVSGQPQNAGHKHPADVIERGAVRLDLNRRCVRIGQRRVRHLSHRQFEILCSLMKCDGTIPKEKLIRSDGSEINPNNVEKIIQRLRKDFGPEGKELIQTVPGGYYFSG